MLPLSPLVLYPVFIGLAVEWVVFFRSPLALSRFAVLPLETRFLDVTPATRDALTSRATDEGTYRTAPSTSLDLARLDGPVSASMPNTKLFFFARPAHFISASSYTFVNRQRCLVRVDLSSREGRVVLEARYYPVGLPSLLLVVLCVSIAAKNFGPLAGALVMAVIYVGMNRWACRKHVDMIEGEVSRRLESLGGGAR